MRSRMRSLFIRLATLILIILPLSGCAGPVCRCVRPGLETSATMCDLDPSYCCPAAFRPLGRLSRCLEQLGLCRHHGRFIRTDHADGDPCVGCEAAVVGQGSGSLSATTHPVQPHAAPSLIVPHSGVTTTFGEAPPRYDTVRPTIPVPSPSYPVTSGNEFDSSFQNAGPARRRLVTWPEPAPHTVFRLPAPPKSAAFAAADQRDEDRDSTSRAEGDSATTSRATSLPPKPESEEGRSDSPPAPSRFEVTPAPRFDQAEPTDSSWDDPFSAPHRFGFNTRGAAAPARSGASAEALSRRARIHRDVIRLETVPPEAMTRAG